MSANPFGRSRFFPDPMDFDTSDGYGLVAIGLPLHREILVDAYSHGIFPWPCGPRLRIPWCSPDPRAVLPLGNIHWPRRLLRTIRSGKYTVSIDRDFPGVIQGCATAGNRRKEMWITPSMRKAYIDLHEAGIAHSVETWHEGRLVGGIYGVALRGFFAGESMFALMNDASKVALHHLASHLENRGFGLFDIQMVTDHTAQFGPREIDKAEYLACLHEALRLDIAF